MALNLKKHPNNKQQIKQFPNTPGVYIFWQKQTPIYVGKAVNLRSRLISYYGNNLLEKTRQMLGSADSVSFIKAAAELEALLLEANLIKKFNPKYNVVLKDDKNPLYIRITADKYPRILTARKSEQRLNNLLFLGPFPSSYKVKQVLLLLRKIFPFANHLPTKRPCLYSQMGLCNPCPSAIDRALSQPEKRKLWTVYKFNIQQVKGILLGRIKYVRRNLVNKMLSLAKTEKFEQAGEIKDQIEALDYITSPTPSVENYLQNPNLYEDIRQQELRGLVKMLTPFYRIRELNRIECFDVSHLFGVSEAASMVVFIQGEISKDNYRRFKIKSTPKMSDTAALEEVIRRRLNHLSDWGIPDLVIVDGGKAQAAVFNRYLRKLDIAVVGIAKRQETLIIPLTLSAGKKYREIILPSGPVKNLIQRIRNEAHRFAVNYHQKLFKKNLLQ